MFISAVERFIECALFGVCIFLLAGSIYLTVKTRFVQIRLLPFLFKSLKDSIKKKGQSEGSHTISPLKALFTSMSTTLGIATMVAPVIAIQLGGPGALLGFLLTSFFAAAATYVEVALSVVHRKTLKEGTVMGGPMQYLKEVISPRCAKWYASCCVILLMGWSAAQANQLVAVLDAEILGDYRVAPMYSGLILVLLIMLVLKGGVKKVGDFSAKIVPFMFVLYMGSCLWIMGSNFQHLGEICSLIFGSLSDAKGVAIGGGVGGVVSALRWGVLKGVQTTEAGVGTQTIAHSMAETQDPRQQGALAMLSTFTAGILSFFSGCTALLAGTWKDPSLSIGMGSVIAAYEKYYSVGGVIIVGISSLLFAFGTILGNSFNGLQCYSYLTNNRKKRYYLFVMSIVIFMGAVGNVQHVWSFIDILLVLIALPHMAVLLMSVGKMTELFTTKKQEPALGQLEGA